ncbi:hypothetical protein P4S73_02470 [Paraglaciecola sp. Hal342]
MKIVIKLSQQQANRRKNGNVEFVTGLETHLVSSDLVIPFEQEKLDSMGARN